MTDTREKIVAILAYHQYENQCAPWRCDCSANFGPPMVDGVDWEHHVADVLMTKLGLV